MGDKLTEIKERRAAETGISLACPTEDVERSVFQCMRCGKYMTAREKPTACPHCAAKPPAPSDIDYLLGEVERLRAERRDIETLFYPAVLALVNALETHGSQCIYDERKGRVVYCPISSACADTTAHIDDCWLGQAVKLIPTFEASQQLLSRAALSGGEK